MTICAFLYSPILAGYANNVPSLSLSLSPSFSRPPSEGFHILLFWRWRASNIGVIYCPLLFNCANVSVPLFWVCVSCSERHLILSLFRCLCLSLAASPFSQQKITFNSNYFITWPTNFMLFFRRLFSHKHVQYCVHKCVCVLLCLLIQIQRSYCFPGLIYCWYCYYVSLSWLFIFAFYHSFIFFFFIISLLRLFSRVCIFIAPKVCRLALLIGVYFF